MVFPDAVDAGLGVPDSRFTYAEGRLFVIFCACRDATFGAEKDLSWTRRLSIANPRTAPYGSAAKRVIESLGLKDRQIAEAQSVAGVNAAMAAGAADAGFAAYASVVRVEPRPPGWLVPRELHDAIRQDAVLLTRAENNAAARKFLDWLQGSEARAVIKDWGYD